MGQFLNNKEPYDKYKTVMNGTFFVDKTEILKELIPALQQEQRFFCITRPRRFGKTVMAIRQIRVLGDDVLRKK